MVPFLKFCNGIRLQQLKEREAEKANLIELKNTLEEKYRREKTKKANKRREESRIRKEILQCADVICTTLSGAGSSSLKQDLAGRWELLYCHF